MGWHRHRQTKLCKSSFTPLKQTTFHHPFPDPQVATHVFHPSQQPSWLPLPRRQHTPQLLAAVVEEEAVDCLEAVAEEEDHQVGEDHPVGEDHQEAHLALDQDKLEEGPNWW